MGDNERTDVELGRGSYRAFQAAGYVTILAAGHTPTPGYRVWLKPQPTDVFPPQHELVWDPPDGLVVQVLTPFQVCTSFRASEPVRAVTVFDADGSHEVPVEKVERRPGPARELVLANHFAVAAGSTLVTYTASNIAGQPVLTYNRRAFTGDQVRREESPLGTLVTVTLAVIADGDRTDFTLLVPPVRVQPGAGAQVRLVGITAVTHSTIAGPPPGQTVTYDVDELIGTADFVVS